MAHDYLRSTIRGFCHGIFLWLSGIALFVADKAPCPVPNLLVMIGWCQSITQSTREDRVETSVIAITLKV